MYRKILFPIKFEEFSLDVFSCVLNFKKAGMEEINERFGLPVLRFPVMQEEIKGLEMLKKAAHNVDGTA